VSFTDEVKQELAGTEVEEGEPLRVELAALLRFAGALVVTGGGGGLRLDLETVSGSTARRAFALVHRRYGVAPELRVQAPGGVQRRRLYGVRLETGGERVARDLGLIDGDGRPAPPQPASAGSAAIHLRGAFLAAGSVSHPDRAPHLEVAAHRVDAAEALAASMRHLTDGQVSVSAPPGADRGGRPRVVVKSGETIGVLLASMGATGAFLRWDERRLRRQLRGEATRLANADAANLRRTVEAASTQVQAVERVVTELGWEGLGDALRTVAIARLANPDASLAEIGQLSDPPLSKTAVHRRLRRLEVLAEELRAGTSDPED
jgi:cell division protein WhiA